MSKAQVNVPPLSPFYWITGQIVGFLMIMFILLLVIAGIIWAGRFIFG